MLSAVAFWGFTQLGHSNAQLNNARNVAMLSQRVPYATLMVRAMSKEFGFAPNSVNAKAVIDALASVHTAVDALDSDRDATAQTHLAQIRDLLVPYDRDLKFVVNSDPKDVVIAYNQNKNLVAKTRDRRIATGKLIDKQAKALIRESDLAVTRADA